MFEKKDLAIIIKPDGNSEVHIPYEDEDSSIPAKQIHRTLRELRKLETVFTELANQTYGKEELF